MYLKVNDNKEQESKLKDFMYISFTPEIYAELRAYVNAFDKECSGCGLVKQYINVFEDKHTEIEYRVSKIYLPVAQQNTGASTDIEGVEINKIITELVQQGISPEELRFHWHSHNDMSVFHSGTDNENYDDLKTGDFLVSIVANKKGELLGRVDFYKPFNIIYNNLPVFIKMLEEAMPHVQTNIDKVKKYEEDNPSHIIYGGHDFRGNMYQNEIEDEEKGAKKNGKKGKKKQKEIFETYETRDTLEAEVLELSYEGLEYLEMQGEIALVRDNNGIIAGFQQVSTGQFFCLELKPLSKSYITDYVERGLDNHVN